MRALGFPELFFMFFMFFVYGVAIFVVWKFYQILARMNDNLSGIRRAVERSGNPPPAT
jgi:hypothetical protein